MPDITQILDAAQAGDPHAADQLLPLVYDELRRLAAMHMAREKPGQTLNATALVHEAYVRLVASPVAPAPGALPALTQPGSPVFANRRHFFAAAAEAMRRILIESARRKRAERHGGGRQRVELQPDMLAVHANHDDLLAVDEALEQLAGEDPATAELVKLHYFAGVTLEEAAEMLGLSARTAYRHWAFARAWLFRKLS